MELPVCPHCSACDWSIRAEVTFTGYVRQSRYGFLDLYADLGPASGAVDYTWDDTQQRNQFFCTHCGEELEASPVANPPLLKEAFDESAAGTVNWRIRSDTEWYASSRINPNDPDAWPRVYDHGFGPAVPRQPKPLPDQSS